MSKHKDPLRFMAGNYLDRVSDACYVELGEATVYFSSGKVIAMIASDCLYRTAAMDSGIIYERIRAALLRQSPKKVQQISRDDLNLLIEAALVNMGSRLIDEKLGLNTE